MIELIYYFFNKKSISSWFNGHILIHNYVFIYGVFRVIINPLNITFDTPPIKKNSIFAASKMTTGQMVDVAQLVRALDCDSRGRRFKSGLPPTKEVDVSTSFFYYLCRELTSYSIASFSFEIGEESRDSAGHPAS
jgi:hypothetical protein|tara:strand:+ start:1298 stop:1702 length:405 start_codon:yes stop_codon:yes gene_type:complete